MKDFNTKLRPEIADILNGCLVDLKPREPLTPQEWCEKYIYLPSATSSKAGRFSLNRTPYFRGVFDLFNDPTIKKIVIVSSAQVGKTTLCSAFLLWSLSVLGAPCLYATSTIELAEEFGRNKFMPIVYDSPKIMKIFQMGGRKESDQARFKRLKNNASLVFLGSTSKNAFLQRTIRIGIGDEVSSWEAPESVALLEKRTTSFQSNSKIMLVSTPRLDDDPIMKQWQLSDKRVYEVACLKCSERAKMEFKNLVFTQNKLKISDEKIYYKCPKCNHRHYGKDQYALVSSGLWKKTAESYNVAGFHLNELVSLFTSWSETAKLFLKARSNHEQLREFMNNSLGEAFQLSDKILEYSELWQRREIYDVPNEIAVLVAGVDVQNNRFEIEVIGYGKGYESWGIQYKVLLLSPAMEDSWSKLDDFLSKTWTRDDGTVLYLARVFIDSGGHFTQDCYRFCKKFKNKPYFPSKGGAHRNTSIIVSQNSKPTGSVVKPLINLAVHEAKNKIYYMIEHGKAEAGLCHFPQSYQEEFFKQLTSERLVKTKKLGREQIRYDVITGRRNEALDIRVMALAAVQHLGDIDFSKPFKKIRTPRVNIKAGEYYI